MAKILLPAVLLMLRYKEAIKQERSRFSNLGWGQSGAGVSRWLILIGMLVDLTLPLLNIVPPNSNCPEVNWRKKKFRNLLKPFFLL